MTPEMTFEEAYAIALAELDAAWCVVRKIHGNADHLNDASSAYTSALSDLQRASQKVFRVKNLMAEFTP